jgi:hypothetical protein
VLLIFHHNRIIQEITFAVKARLFCGREDIDWEYFVAAIDTLWSINASRRYFSNTSSLAAMRVIHTIHHMKTKKPYLSILESLNFFYASECEKAQDRIIALLPVSNDEADYQHLLSGLSGTNDKNIFYHRFAVFNLERTKSLDLLHCAGAFRPRGETRPCGVSWVPDWTSKPRFFSFLKIKRFNAGDAGRMNVSFAIEEDETKPGYQKYLVVKGFIVDYIKDVQTRDISSRNTIQDVKSFFLNDWARLADNRYDLATTLVADKAHSQTVSTRFQLPMPNGRSGGRANSQGEIDEWAGFRSLFESSDPWRQDLLTTRQNQDPIRLYNHILSYTMKGRRLFKTQSGRLGIGPEDCRVGDPVAIFNGSRTPFVLHPATRTASTDPDRFFCELIGDCYVHNVMDGSAMRTRRTFMDFWIT